jgi:hypothetical protein
MAGDSTVKQRKGANKTSSETTTATAPPAPEDKPKTTPPKVSQHNTTRLTCLGLGQGRVTWEVVEGVHVWGAPHLCERNLRGGHACVRVVLRRRIYFGGTPHPPVRLGGIMRSITRPS